MTLKSSDSLFKRAAPAGSAILMAAVLAACGGGPIDNSHLSEMPPAKTVPEQEVNESLAVTPPPAPDLSSDAGEKKDPAENAGGGEKTAASPEKASEALSKLRSEWSRDASKWEKNLKLLVIGLDSETLIQTPEDGGFHISLHGKDVFEYYKNNCPIRSGPDAKEIYECMAGIYYGKSEKGNVCFTSISPNGLISHVNGNSLVPEFRFEDARGLWSKNSVTGEIEFALLNSVQNPSGSGVVPAPIAPEFTRFGVGGREIMILNGMRVSNETKQTFHESNDKEVQDFKVQQISFSMDFDGEKIRIFQKNTDRNYGTGLLEDTCIVSLKGSS